MPRWRTMIEPALTSWPSPAFTPRRWPTLSRPFLTLPPAFLWAISSTRPSSWCGSASGRHPHRGVGFFACRASSALRPWLGGGLVRGRRLGLGCLVGLGGLRLRRLGLGGRLVVGGRLGLRRSSRPWPWLRALPGGCRRLGPDRQLGGELGILGGLRDGGLLGALALGLGLLLGLLGRLGGALAAERDVGDAQEGQLLAMTLLDPAAGLRAVLEGDELGPTRLGDDLGADRGVRDQRATDRRVVAVGDEQDAIDRDRLARLGVEQLDFELGADLDAILLSAGLDDCVHGSSGFVSGDRARRPRHRT